MTKEHLEAWKTDDLIAELDRRLEEQGVDVEVGGVAVIVDYLREDWSVVALPPEIADRIVDSVPTPTTLLALAGELKQAIKEHHESTEAVA